MKKVDVGVESLSMSKSVECYFCNEKQATPAIQCVSCNKILPFYDLNPFALFGVQPTLQPNFKQIDAVYFNFQRVLHPDKLRNASEQELIWADEHISQINSAYKALKNKLECAKAAYLYTQNIYLPMVSFKPELVPQPDMSFLQLIMELSTKNDEAANKELHNNVLHELDAAIQALDADKILHAISKFTYLNRLSQL